ncbi:DNA-3-methyladenine glycosylase II [Parafrankia irregularis]|uniref:DNA-3-methyladenine glycosylase II n=1 Tax=Parafrankia irregularis TaxID=795642 RepID=A0A0S4QWH5_9ACTN|nr:MULTISPECIES: DNA-3-methyladenine glycosylase [Parafrankia]MBE3201579.1 DNA-3-methyladenine glycosylase 2 family protein [Parafrankia sp. CH37]CUU59346.1 DNA-3-methyladenine glycosylase II [Parafrankia irregularis]
MSPPSQPLPASPSAPAAAVGTRVWHRFRIPARPPFRWDHSLDFVCGFPATRGEQVVAGAHLVKAWRIDGCLLLTRIGPWPADDEGAGADPGGGPGVGGDGPGVEVTVAAPHSPSEDVLDALTDRLRFYLSLDDDLTAFAAAAAADPPFARVEHRLHGYHQVKFPSPYENIVWAILAQRTPITAARAVKLRLMQHLNPPLAGFGAEVTPFPSPDQLAELPLEVLTGILGNSRKAGYVSGSVRRLLEIEETFLRTGDVDEVERFLLSLPGIGPWSATFVMIRGLGRMERLPTDTELLKAGRRVYGAEVSASDLVSLAAPYGAQVGYWAHYLRAGG